MLLLSRPRLTFFHDFLVGVGSADDDFELDSFDVGKRDQSPLLRLRGGRFGSVANVGNRRGIRRKFRVRDGGGGLSC